MLKNLEIRDKYNKQKKMAEERDFSLEILIGKVLKTLSVPRDIKDGDLYFLSKDFYVKALFHDNEFSIESIESDPKQNRVISFFTYESGLEKFVEAEKQKNDKKCLGFIPIHEFAELMFRKIGLKPIESETEFSEQTMYKIYGF